MEKKQEWTKLERRGDTIVLLGRSKSTASGMKADYDLACWATRQLNQWVSQKREKGQQPTLEEAKKDFSGNILVGDEHKVPYATDDELRKQINNPQSPSGFAEEIVIRRWGFTEATGRTYLRRKKRSHPKSPKITSNLPSK